MKAVHSLFLFTTAALAAPKPVDFIREIRPILSDNCFACHGPDEKQRMANLRLDTKDGAARILTVGDPAHSKLFQRISADKPAMRMPPPQATTQLKPEQVELIRRWIAEGARYDTHWAYAPPQRPEPPEVTQASWPRNPIDRFILARLEREGLKPSAEANRATLLRRVTYDLTGLPPTPQELDAFLKDKSPNAYERAVDRLLASPHYGERMAMQWLDLARYADTHGYHIDSHREMWHWRDWVIQSFNRNLPFDQFTIQQLAGDLLPNATDEQRLATGFNRNHMINFEGGAIPEEYQNEYVVDRVEATSTVWMGMTMGCARCHDHKYDPIKQKEFYQFYAFFNTIPEKGLDGRKGNAEPVLPLPSEMQRLQLQELARVIPEKEHALEVASVPALQAEWEKTRLTMLPDAPRAGLVAHYELDGSFADLSGGYHHGRIVKGDVTYSNGPVGKAADFDGQTRVELTCPAPEGKFAFSMWLKPAGKFEMTVIESRGYGIYFDEFEPVPGLKRGAHLIVRLGNDQVRTKERLIMGALNHVAVNYDGSTVRIHVNGKPVEVEPSQEAPVHAADGEASLVIATYKGQIDDLRIYDRPLTDGEIHQLAADQPTRATLFINEAKRSKDQKDRLRDYFLTYDAPLEVRQTYAALNAAKAQKERLDESVPTVMVMAEMEKPRDTYVLGRGDYRNHGEKVTAAVPSMLPPLPPDARHDRLGLAQWLVDPSHPLTARVAVNRYWQLYFGYGIVKTAEDFGSQGEAPVHPELLDWLATEFVRTGWDIKAMQRLIVTSATYRQSSSVTAELVEKDPENRLLARGPRFRLPAEMVRDNALAVSGLLNDGIGGPSVFPYSPKGLWEDIAYGDVYSAQSYTPSHGKDLYRRSMYSFWKRTAPPASLATFDAPDREKCTARRTLTNTPLQALVLLNDPTYIEAARTLAQRIITEGGKDDAHRIRFAYRAALARTPSTQEVQVLRDTARAELAEFRQNRDAALKLLKVGESPYDTKLDVSELAAWTTVASMVLNLDEAITKE